ncbi:probable galactinol--sucrose galactosyltransferase 2 isoform X2 [Olea europaea subsp. europaea]|uniref:Probable galactinol--sucrose galactosyltransferase 2 isoform X2 n=1 Tax=Olea europaea subsp. europaea TaxID=158383 RepID=A0A8S0T1S0_OLEEU|nr:probable galactinol--sucrose galactosyltransferase 2 isoform X2 [Olea europaea subsp. europaea]
MQADWDMFHSLHPAADYHAAARAVGGCSIYVSDKPGKHNFELLKKQVLPDGLILRVQLPGRPTVDCLFADPGAGWCKVERKTRIHDASPSILTGSVKATDVDTIAQIARPEWNGDAVVYAYRSSEVVLTKRCLLLVTLKVLEYELYHFCLVIDITPNISFAPIGLLNMFNSSGAVEHCKVHLTSQKVPEHFDEEVASDEPLSADRLPQATVFLKVRGAGLSGVYCSQRPLKCTVANTETSLSMKLQLDW